MRLQIILLNCALAVLALLAIGYFGPMLETRFYPVFSKFKIISIVDIPGEDAATLSIEGYKLRDCIPQGYAWYSGDFGTYLRQLNVAGNARNQAPMIPLGKFYSTFKVEGLRESTAPKLYAETFSRCWPFWVTRSVVYP